MYVYRVAQGLFKEGYLNLLKNWPKIIPFFLNTELHFTIKQKLFFSVHSSEFSHK